MNRWAFPVLVTMLAVVGIASYWTADLGQTVGTVALPRASRVLVFGIPRLGLQDVTVDKMPNLVRLGERGAIGSLRVKTDGPIPNVAQAYAAVGAGQTTAIGSVAGDAYGARDRYLGTTAIAAQRLATGHARHGDVVIPSVAPLASKSSPVGTLEALLAGHRHRIGVVSNADTTDQQGRRVPGAPAALAATDPYGFVTPGDISRTLLARQQTRPYGLEVDGGAFVRAVLDMFGSADVVVADPGETLRAQSYLPTQSKAAGALARRRALQRTDALLGDLARRVPPDTRIIVFGVTPGTKQWALTPIVVAGAGVRPGRIGSPSTHRTGMGTLADVPATVLATLGVPVPGSLQGSALRETPGRVSWGYDRRHDQMFATHSTTTSATMVSAIAAQSALFVAALIFIGLGRPGRRLSIFFTIAALTFAAWPLATFLLRLSVTASGLGYASLAITWVLALVVALVAYGGTRDGIRSLVGITLATFAVIVVDLATGAHLIFGSFFGYTPDTSGRYFGINNSVFAILGACAVVLAVFATEYERPPVGRVPRLAATIFAVATIVDGAPWMGADVGGILTFVPVFGITLWALSGRRVRWPYLITAFGAGVAALALVVGIDLARQPDQRTHIGRFFLGVSYGQDKALPSTIVEKWQANTAVLAHSLWAWVIPITAVYALYMLVVVGAWRRRLPLGSPVRIGTVSALAVGVVGWLLNDSGIVVTALVFVYLGPMLILVTLRDIRRRGEVPRPPGRKALEVS